MSFVEKVIRRIQKNLIKTSSLPFLRPSPDLLWEFPLLFPFLSYTENYNERTFNPKEQNRQVKSVEQSIKPKQEKTLSQKIRRIFLFFEIKMKIDKASEFIIFPGIFEMSVMPNGLFRVIQNGQ